MADPVGKDILFGGWFLPRVLSSTRYGTVENGAAGTECACIVLCCFFYVYT